MELAYLASLKDARTILSQAAMEAEASLPEAIHKEHYIAAKHSPAAWKMVYHGHLAQSQARDILVALLIRSQVAEMLTMLDGLILEGEQTETASVPKLARVRRSQ